MRKIDQDLDGYVRQFASIMAKANARNFKYSSLYDLYLKEGFMGNPEAFTSAEEKNLLRILTHLTHQPEAQQCFYNSQAVSLDSGLGYAEGLVLSPGLPVALEHGYNFLPSGKVVDLTLKPYGEKNTCDPRKLLKRAKLNQKNAYIGISFPPSLIRRTWFDTHQALMLLGYPPVQEILFEKGYPLEWKISHGTPGLGNSAVPSPLELGDRYTPSRENRAEPSPLELSIQGYPSRNFRAVPSPLELGDRYTPSRENRAEPSPLELGVTGAVMRNTRVPSLSGPRPEEEWLNEPEREGFPADETRSPFEGDIPPWAQRGYQGKLPMKGKVFYITAYVGSGPEKIFRTARVKSPVMGAARPVKDVGSMPRGVQFGTDFMFHPFAAIPARHEDFREVGPVVQYLEGLLEEIGAIAKILLEASFPDPNATEVRLSNGRWFPVDMNAPMYGGITYLNAYNVNRLYGGAHEGGWWFDAGDPVASVPMKEEDFPSMEWNDYLRMTVGWTSKYDRYSVLGHDDFDIRAEDYFARPFPEETPRYS